MALKWPKIDSRVGLVTTIQCAIHIKTYCNSIKEHYKKYYQGSISLETLLTFTKHVKSYCDEVLKVKVDERID
jgi:hypothetical protein